MPTTLTLKNIPADLYERLKLAAEARRRSLNREAIVCLETVLPPRKMTPGERLMPARQLQETLQPNVFLAPDIEKFRRRGLP